ncbi:MAG TPA: PIN domain-containing protein [Gemmatimonadaceae bacterium]|jgi:predicted nucleic acid-binding protein|nr:PIN domain-containing protein [Gemmatimonadaceae bacterium]
MNTSIEESNILANKVFLDTSFALAAFSVTDRHHARALELAFQLQKQNVQIITTHAIMCEIGNHFAKAALKRHGLRAIDAYRRDPSVTILPVTDALYERGLSLYCERLDQDWSLTDCISLIVMQDERLTDALTYDKHFEQSGNRALLRDTYYDARNRPTY